MREVLTGDGSLTFYSEEYSEMYHSQTGALEEAFKKYAEVVGLKDGFRVLDICFGLGYNTLAAIHTVSKIEVVGLEKDKAVLDQINGVDVPDNLKEDYGKVKKAAEDLEYEDDKVKIKIILGDALETIDLIEGKFDAVFLDPFSLTKNPELWSSGFFKKIRNKMNKGTILATYSCARKVREDLKEAGFEVKDGPKVKRRGPSTIATS